MELSNKQVISALVVVAVVSAAATRYLWPQILTKVVSVEHEVIKNNVVTVIKTVQQPGGTVETDTTITDNTITSTSIKNTSTTYQTAQWHAGLSVGSSIHTLQPVYDLRIERRLFGPVFLSAGGSTDGVARVGLAIEF